MERQKVTLEMLVDGIKRNPIAVICVCASAGVGAILGIVAYYNNWLG